MGAVWAIADLHLSFGVPGKEMHIFGENWRDHPEKIKEHWESKISHDDLVLIPGDISWAKHLEDAVPDLEWIHARPGTKVMIKGNHDFWMGSISQVKKVLPPSIHIIHNNSFTWNDVTVGGARLWDTDEFGFDGCINFQKNAAVKPLTEKDLDPGQREKIFQRELQRLEESLKTFDPKAKTRIVMTHYPPVSADLKPSRASAILERFKVDVCVFGHIHNVRRDVSPLFGEKDGVRYICTAADHIDFDPVKILPYQ